MNHVSSAIISEIIQFNLNFSTQLLFLISLDNFSKNISLYLQKVHLVNSFLKSA